MCMISQEALEARNRASANSASFPGTAFHNPFPLHGYSGLAVTQVPPLSSRDAAKDEYNRNELTLTIRHLVAGSFDGRWSGTLEEILAAGQAKNWLVYDTIREISWKIWALEGSLRLFDNIYHYEWRQDGQAKHFFCVCKVDDGAIQGEVYDSFDTRADPSVIDGRALALYVDVINKTRYVGTDTFVGCPGYLLNNMLGHPDCPNKGSDNRCKFLGCSSCNTHHLDRLRNTYYLNCLRNAYQDERRKGSVELMFGVTMDLPSKYYKEVIQGLGASERLTLLKLRDRVLAAKMNYECFLGMQEEYYASAQEVLENARNDFDCVLRQFHAVNEDDAFFFKHPDFAKQGTYHPYFSRFYDEDQFVERSLRGEPVLFHQGRLYFESFVFEHGFQPGPFPGLDLYTKDGEYVDPEEFSLWLKEMLPERSKNFHRRVGFWGCPACVVNAGDLVRYVNFKTGGLAVLGASYRFYPVGIDMSNPFDISKVDENSAFCSLILRSRYM